MPHRNISVRDRFARRGGFALVAVIIVLVVVTILGFGYLSLGFHEWNLARKEADNAEAFFLAEAGRHRALYELSLDWNNLPSYTDEQLGDGSYSVTASRNPDDSVTIEATGRVRQMERTVVQEARRQ